MIKKILALFVATLFIGGCASSQSKESEKTYDNEFITALAKGLDARWEVTEKPSNKNAPFSTDFAKYPQIELKEIEEYKDKKFEDDKLKELAITYINELKETKKATEEGNRDDFDSHQLKRFTLLVSINNIKELPVKNQKILKEMLSAGNTVEKENTKQEAIKNLFSSVKFEVDKEKSNQFSTEYYAIVENTTEYNIDYIDLLITLKDSDDVNYKTTYASQSNWKKGTKVRFEFTDFDQKLAKYELQVRDVRAEKP